MKGVAAPVLCACALPPGGRWFETSPRVRAASASPAGSPGGLAGLFGGLPEPPLRFPAAGGPRPPGPQPWLSWAAPPAPGAGQTLHVQTPPRHQALPASVRGGGLPETPQAKADLRPQHRQCSWTHTEGSRRRKLALMGGLAGAAKRGPLPPALAGLILLPAGPFLLEEKWLLPEVGWKGCPGTPSSHAISES